MPRPLVIIHGWSDNYKSFQTLAAAVSQRRGVAVNVIALADYISMNDFVTFGDLVAAMDKAWTDFGLPRTPATVDAIVHSTGGLVIRDWLVTTFKTNPAPIKNLVMLAPANFGSPLAHKGRSFLGRVAKGFTNDQGMFQTGTYILKGLELASPYSWDLAERDRLAPGTTIYGKKRVLCTVLVGNHGYDGIRAIANEDGSDGTVRSSTANLNCVALDVDFTADPQKPTARWRAPNGPTAFGVVDGHNHATITLNESTLRNQADKDLLDQIIAALDVDDAGFDAWCTKLDKQTADAMAAGAKSSATQGFQNTVVRVIDQDDHPVTDYLIEFYEEDDDRDLIAKLFHTTALADVHAYGADPSYRSLFINCTKLTKMVDKIDEALSISITAHPVIPSEAPVGFRMFRNDDAGAVKIKEPDIPKFFQPNRTVLVTIRIRREREDKVFRIKAAGSP